MGNIDTRSITDMLVYADSVNRARAIPVAVDNLKPIHRKILYTLYITKLTSDKKYAKSMATVGEVLKLFSPHGDTATYGALARLAQTWKLRYPLVDGQGNFGNLLGDGPAAARYTNAKLTRIGDLMLEDIDKNCVDFIPNYDETTTEPLTLPSKFPFLLCGNNTGIGVSLSSDVVSHNFTEVKGAIEYYMEHKDCTISDLMKFIKGPDFPTGGRIINGEDLYQIYSTGRGALKMEAHYDIKQSGAKTLIIFHDIPYGVEIEDGVKSPLKKMILDEGYEQFENIDIKKTKDNFFDITITISKKANVAQALSLLLSKTKLAASVKVNNTFVLDNKIVTLNLKQMIETYVNYRSNIIKRIAQNDYDKTNHKLTIVLGLQKCMSNIDRVIEIIRGADSPAAAKLKLMPEFNLNSDQADAVLDMKLSRLSRLDVQDLDKKQKDHEKILALLKDRIDNETSRFAVIKADLEEIKKVVGKDERLTEVTYGSAPVVHGDGMTIEVPSTAIKKILFTYADGQTKDKFEPLSQLIAVNSAYGQNDICVYNAAGEMGVAVDNPIGGFNKNGGSKIVCVTANGNIKCSAKTAYKFSNTKTEKALKVKDGDQVVFIAAANDSDFIIVNGGNGEIFKFAVKNLTVATKATVGVKTGFEHVESAIVCGDSDTLFMVGSDGKGKLTLAKDITVDKRGNKPQSVYKSTKWIGVCNEDREGLFVVPKRGNNFLVKRDELSLKGKTAAGATISSRQLEKIL